VAETEPPAREEPGAPEPAPEEDPLPAAPEEGHEFPLFGGLVEHLDEEDPTRRGAACWTLGQLRYGPAGKRLSRILSKDTDALVRVASAQALARIGGPASAQALIRGLRDEDDLVRDTCIVSLGKLGDTQGISPLEEMLRKLRDPDEGLRRRLQWALDSLSRVDDPGTTPDRRRGGVSKKIRRYLEKVHARPRDGIAHNNLAVAYYHAAEHDLAVRHCLLAKELGARVHWLWSELEKAGHDPSSASLSEEDQRFLDGEEGSFSGGDPSPSVRLEPEPTRVELRRARGGSGDPGPYRVPTKEPYRVPDRKGGPGGGDDPRPYRVGQDRGGRRKEPREGNSDRRRSRRKKRR